MRKLMTSLLALVACTSLFAQSGKGENLYMNFGAGIITVCGDNAKVNPNLHLQFGQFITPVWGWRAEVGGLWQSLGEQSTGYSRDNKVFAEINADATLNLINLFGDKRMDRVFNLYLFGGPTMSISSAVTKDETVSYEYTQSVGTKDTHYTVTPTTVTVWDEVGTKARFGATVGLGAGFKVSPKILLNLDARYGVAPSIFGWGSDRMPAENTFRATAGITYVFGGLK